MNNSRSVNENLSITYIELFANRNDEDEYVNALRHIEDLFISK